MKQGALYLQLQQTFGKVRMGWGASGGGKRPWCVGLGVGWPRGVVLGFCSCGVWRIRGGFGAWGGWLCPPGSEEGLLGVIWGTRRQFGDVGPSPNQLPEHPAAPRAVGMSWGDPKRWGRGAKGPPAPPGAGHKLMQPSRLADNTPGLGNPRPQLLSKKGKDSPGRLRVDEKEGRGRTKPGSPGPCSSTQCTPCGVPRGAGHGGAEKMGSIWSKLVPIILEVLRSGAEQGSR